MLVVGKCLNSPRNAKIKTAKVPIERCVCLSLRIGFRPEDFLFLDVIVHTDAILDVHNRSEVTGALVLRHDGDVNNLVLLDDHEEGLVLFDAGAVVTESISGSAFAGVSWCPDCVTAEPIVERLFDAADFSSDSILLYVGVGPRPG